MSGKLWVKAQSTLDKRNGNEWILNDNKILDTCTNIAFQYIYIA